MFDLSWISQTTCSWTPSEAKVKFFVLFFMEFLNFVLEGSMKGWAQDFLAWPLTFNIKSWKLSKKNLHFAFHGTFKLCAQVLHKRLNKKICLPSLQLLVSKVKGRTIKFSLSSPKNKSSQPLSFQMCRNFFKYVLWM